jgi:hypothetical protein
VGCKRTSCLLLLLWMLLLLLLPGQSASGVQSYATQHRMPALPCLQQLLESWCGSSSNAPPSCPRT